MQIDSPESPSKWYGTTSLVLKPPWCIHSGPSAESNEVECKAIHAGTLNPSKGLLSELTWKWSSPLFVVEMVFLLGSFSSSMLVPGRVAHCTW